MSAPGAKHRPAKPAAPVTQALPWAQRHGLTLLVVAFSIFVVTIGVAVAVFAASSAPAIFAAQGATGGGSMVSSAYAEGGLPNGQEPVEKILRPRWQSWPAPSKIFWIPVAFFAWHFIYRPALKTRVVIYFKKELSHIALFMAIAPLICYMPKLGSLCAGNPYKDHEGDTCKGGAGAQPRECKPKSWLARAVSSANTLRTHLPGVVTCMLAHSDKWQEVMTPAHNTSTLSNSTAPLDSLGPEMAAHLGMDHHAGNNPPTWSMYEGMNNKLLSDSLMLPVPYRGPWSPGQDASDCLEPHEPSDFVNERRKTPLVALISSNDRAIALTKQYGLPIIVASPDSGATAHVTQHLDALTDCKPCNEVFGQANGHVTRCTAIGSLPVICRTEQGPMVRFIITNVRCVHKKKTPSYQ